MKVIKAMGWIAWCSFAAAAAVGCSAAGPVEEGDAQGGLNESEDALRLPRLCAGPRDLECRGNQFCDAARPGRCPGDGQLGVCRTRPDVCTDLFDPVCGCDGVTYPNACNAAAVGVAVDRRGACAPSGEFCGGIAGIPCPEGQACIDDPSDECDPNMGGNDCGGICVGRGTFCGGIAGFPCPEGQKCIDDPSDDCDPNRGGADCGGICVGGTTNPCAAVLCPVGSDCVAKGGVGRCVPQR